MGNSLLPRPRSTRLRLVVLIALGIACGLSYFDRQVLSILAPTITNDLGMNDVDYSWVVFAYIFGYSIMFSVGGWLIDRIGTRTGMMLAVGVWSLASLLHALAHNMYELGAFRFLLGVGEGGCFPGAAKGVVEWTSDKQRAIAMGAVTSGGSAIGAVIAPPLVVLAAIYAGWRGAFLATGATGALWVVFWLFFYPNSEDSKLASDEERLSTSSPALPKKAATAAVSRLGWRGLFSFWEVRGLVAARFLFDPVFYFYMFWIPQYLHQARGASLIVIGQLTWIPFLVLGISSVLGGWASDRLVRRGATVDRARKILLIAAAALAPVSILVATVGHIGMAIAMICVFMLAHGFWITNYMTVIGDLFPLRVASVVGLTGTAGGIGGFLSSLVIGRVVQNFSFTPVFIAAGLIYPVSAAILLIAIRRVRPLDVPANLGSGAAPEGVAL